MKQPTYILSPGTRIITHATLHSQFGLRVDSCYLNARQPSAKATLKGPVGGHGGDVYWAKNEDGTEAVYGWFEFELDESSTPAVPSPDRRAELEAAIVKATGLARAICVLAKNGSELHTVALEQRDLLLSLGVEPTPVEVIVPAPGENAPDLSELNGYMLRGAKHHGLCGCTPCAEAKKNHRIDVHPFALGDAKAREKGEPTAVLEHGGVRVFFPLTFLHNLVGLFYTDRRSGYAESQMVTGVALKEIERRMWRSLKR